VGTSGQDAVETRCKNTFANEERAWSHMIVHTKLSTADIWMEDVTNQIFHIQYKMATTFMVMKSLKTFEINSGVTQISQ